MKRAYMLALIFSAISTAPIGARSEVFKLVTIGYAPGVSFSSNDADRIISKMNEIIAKAGGACKKFQFARSGQPVVVETMTPDINVASELEGVIDDSPYAVNIVRTIGYCGGIKIGGVAGCSTAGSSIAARLYSSDSQNAVIWLHEYGHTQKLSSALEGVGKSHTTRDAAVMNAVVGPSNTSLIEKECGLLAGSSTQFASINLPNGEAAEVVADTSISDPDLERINALIEGQFTDHTEATAGQSAPLTTKEREYLRDVLLDDSKLDSWVNAVNLLGSGGSADDIGYLIGFYFDQKDNAMAQAAVLQVPVAVGELTRLTGSQVGVPFLQAVIDPNSDGNFAHKSTEEQDFLKQAAVQAQIGAKLTGLEGPSGEAEEAAQALDPAVGNFVGNSAEFKNELRGLDAQVKSIGSARMLFPF